MFPTTRWHANLNPLISYQARPPFDPMTNSNQIKLKKKSSTPSPPHHTRSEKVWSHPHPASGVQQCRCREQTFRSWDHQSIWQPVSIHVRFQVTVKKKRKIKK